MAMEKKEESVSKAMEVAKSLRTINLNDKLDTKPVGKNQNRVLRYLPWSVAWDEVLKRYPESTYAVITFDENGHRMENGLPYQRMPIGYLVWTSVTIEGVTHEMWLPVMDGSNNPLMDEPYTVTNKYGSETDVPPVTITAVNRSIMRCLVKNLAMFGLGLYIYSNDDTPSDDDTSVDPDTGEVSEPEHAHKEVKAPTLEEAYARKLKVGKNTFPMGDLVDKATDASKGQAFLEKLADGDGEDAAAAKVILEALANGAVHFPQSAKAQA